MDGLALRSRRASIKSGDRNGGPRATAGSPALVSGRAAVGALLIVVAAIGTFLLASGRRTPSPPPHVVASRDLAAGAVVRTEDLTTVAVALPPSVEAAAFRHASAVVGMITTGPIRAGSLLETGEVVDAHNAAPSHEVALVLPIDRTVGADLVTGQHVSVLATEGGCTIVVAPQATVQQIGRPNSGVTGTAQLVRLSVANSAEVLAVVHAARTGEVTLTAGTEPVNAPVLCKASTSP